MSKQTIVSPSVGDMEQINQDNIGLWSKIHLATDFLNNATEITGQQYVIVTREEYDQLVTPARVAPAIKVQYSDHKKKRREARRKGLRK